MQNDEEVSRRIFLERLAAGALLGAAGAGSQSALASSNSAAWTPPPALKNPNILIIMVDQMRAPTWLSSSQMAALSSSVLPNIMGRIQNNAYSFDEFFVAATVCTTSRSCLLTGLYAPQTAMYSNADVGTSAPALNPAFPRGAKPWRRSTQPTGETCGGSVNGIFPKNWPPRHYCRMASKPEHIREGRPPTTPARMERRTRGPTAACSRHWNGPAMQ